MKKKNLLVTIKNSVLIANSKKYAKVGALIAAGVSVLAWVNYRFEVIERLMDKFKKEDD